jgi:hypothetical protein
MYYKVERGCDLFDELKQVQNEVDTVEKAAHDFVMKITDGKEDAKWFGKRGKRAGGIAAISFKKGWQPEGWVVENKCYPNFYRPHARNKAMATVRNEIESLPVVEYDRINKIFRIDRSKLPYVGPLGMRWFSGPGITWKDDIILLKFVEQWLVKNHLPKIEGLQSVTFEEYTEKVYDIDQRSGSFV